MADIPGVDEPGFPSGMGDSLVSLDKAAGEMRCNLTPYPLALSIGGIGSLVL